MSQTKAYEVCFWERVHCRTVVEATTIEEAESKATAKFNADLTVSMDFIDSPSEVLAVDGADFYETEEVAS